MKEVGWWPCIKGQFYIGTNGHFPIFHDKKIGIILYKEVCNKGTVLYMESLVFNCKMISPNVCLFNLMLYVTVNNLSVMLGQFPVFLS